jgi:signal transduction histidine kinase
MSDDERSASVLIVDDHAANLTALSAVLEPLDVPIVRARSGAAALRETAQRDFAVIVMDVHMEGLDGYEATALIRERERSRDVPVIFLTALYDDPDHTRRGYALGAVDYISKPIDPDALRAKVGAFVALYRRAQLAERRRTAEREQLRDLFVGILGHDLRNPLNAITMATQLIARDPDLSERHRREVDWIDRATLRMQRLINDVLDLTRGQLGGGIPITLSTVDLGALCHAVVEECRLAHSSRKLVLEAADDVRGQWDADRLAQVASNLISNALQHSTVDPIVVTVRDEGQFAVLAVHNRGAPIAPELLPTLFEPFQRREDGSQGLGLGLYIVREIVRAHGGHIDARSTEAGTTFTVRLVR